MEKVAIETYIFSCQEIEQALPLCDYIPIIEHVHKRHADHQIYEPDLLHANVAEGEFHLKTGGIRFSTEEYYGVKINGGFFKNRTNYHLPNILGIIYICDARNGYPLAIMDSTVISRYRTGAATAVAAKYLAPKTQIHLGVFGYGTQAEIQIRSLAYVCDLQEIRISGRNPDKARLLIEKLQTEYPFPIYWDTPENTARNSNILVTTTPSRHYYIDKNWIVPGTFIAAIGADSPGKQELSPELVASSVIVADIKKQVCQVGESQHALRESLISPDDIYAELGEIVTGRKKRPEPGKTILYDSTGTALQDIGVGIHLYHLLKQKHSIKFKLFN